MRLARLLPVAAVFLAVAPATVRAQSCAVNGAGGPSELILTSTATGSDIDLGTQGGDYHNLPFPAGSQLRVCLSGCDTAGDSQCAADGGAVTVAGLALGPPIPLYAGSTGVCLAIKFTTAPNGTADFVTGAIDLSASLSAAAYVSLITTASTKICPRCNGAGVGLAGTCDSGARVGQACTVDDVVTVPDQPGGSQDYNVSRDCQPSGSPFGSIALSLTMTTGAAMVGNGPTCAGQTSADNCSGTCSAGCAAGANNGGVSQLCCSDNTSRACFPDPIIRNGVAAAPAPGGTTFPKSGDETLVSAFCAPSTSNVALDSNVGVPGPVALIIPVSGDWLLTPTPPSTTTTTTTVGTTSTSGTGPTSTSIVGSTSTSSTSVGSTSTTLPSGCAVLADCNDDDPCTDDACTAGQCSNTRETGATGARCLLASLVPPDICLPETIDPKLLDLMNRKVAKALTLVQKALTASTNAKRTKAIKKANANLKAVVTKATKTAGKGKISAACAAAIQQAIAEIQQALASP